MKSSFKSPPADSAVATVEEPKQELAAPPTAGISGGFTAEDISIPYLSLLQPTSEIIEGFPGGLGHFIYDKQLDLGNSIEVLFWNLTKSFAEEVEFGEQGAFWDTEEEAKASGLAYRKKANISLFIVVPSDSEAASMACMEHEGKAYILARYTVNQGRAFRNVAGVLLRDFGTFLKGDYSARSYTLASSKPDKWYAPGLRVKDVVSPELRELVKEKTGF